MWKLGGGRSWGEPFGSGREARGADLGVGVRGQALLQNPDCCLDYIPTVELLDHMVRILLLNFEEFVFSF